MNKDKFFKMLNDKYEIIDNVDKYPYKLIQKKKNEFRKKYGEFEYWLLCRQLYPITKN